MWLVAGRKNNYHPYLVRPIGMVVVILAVLTVNITYNFTVSHNIQVLGYATDLNVDEVINQTNNQRQANGLTPLSVDSKLAEGANAKAQDMLRYDYWAHVSPSGVQPWYFFTNSGYSYSTAGENLARNFDSTSSVVNGWMNSAEHRNNILSSTYSDIGVAVVNGVMEGKETTLVVAFYGSLSAVPKPTPVIPSPIIPPTMQSAVPTESELRTDVPAVELPSNNSPDITANNQPIPTEKKSGQDIKTSTLNKGETKTPKNVQLKYKNSLNWAQKVTISILSLLFLVNVLKHTIVWRTQKRGWRHIWMRSHPAAQYILIMLAILATTTSGVGLIK